MESTSARSFKSSLHGRMLRGSSVQCLSMYGVQLQELSCQTQHLDDASLHFPAIFTSLRVLAVSPLKLYTKARFVHKLRILFFVAHWRCKKISRKETPKRVKEIFIQLPEPLQESHKIVTLRPL